MIGPRAFDLSSRVALVTGAGQGIGAGIARSLASAGAAVAVNDLHGDRAAATVEAIRSAGGRALAVAADVTDSASVSAMVGEVETALGAVDVLVNNAGIPADGMALTRFLGTVRADWERFIDLNLYGVMECVAAVLPGMVERRHGRIVMISSEAGRLGAGVGVSLYGASKAAAVGFSKSLAFEVARKGVTVNCLSLGLMDNSGGDPALGASAIPIGRTGSPADAAAAVLYLASDEAAWVTGQTLPVNGGLATS